MLLNDACDVPPSKVKDVMAGLADGFAYQLQQALGSRAGLWDRTEPPVALWYDAHGWLNTAQLVSYVAPTEEHPERPLIVRATVNFYETPQLEFLPEYVGAEEAPSRRNLWSLELSALPGEVYEVASWIASFARAQAARDVTLIKEPPFQCRFWPRLVLECRYAWTQRAWEAMEPVNQQIEADRLGARRAGAPV